MLLYKYDEITKEYLGYFEAYEDPLETIKKGEPVYVIPPCSVEERPEQPEEGYAVVFKDGMWKQEEDHRGLVVYDSKGNELVIAEIGPIPEGYTLEKKVTLKEVKDKKREEICAAYNEAYNQEVTVEGISVKVEEAVDIKIVLDIYGEEYTKVNYKGEIVDRESLVKVYKYLYIRSLALPKRKMDLLKILQSLKGKKAVEDLIIDFDVASQIEELFPLELSEIIEVFS